MRVGGVLGAGLVIALVGCGSDDNAGSGSGTDSSTGQPDPTTTGTPATTGGSTSSDSASGTTTGPADSSSGGEAESSSGGGEESTSTGEPSDMGPFESCYDGVFVNGFPIINYDGLGLPVGEHCLGTNFQDIDEVERVVFLGDSVTGGTPPTAIADYYRNILADALADRFALSFGANKGLWQAPDVFNGTSVVRESGDFASCAEWGARTDDLIAGNQLEDCYPQDTRDLRTLTIITMGGNDLARIAQDSGGKNADPMVAWDLATSAVDHMRESAFWLKDEENFPNGHFVVFANVYEFTDGTGMVESCNLSGLAGFEPIESLGDALLVIGWIEDQYARIAQETESDMIFMFEEFMGRGFLNGDPSAPGYRGPGGENWFDLTCIHPTPTGHGAIADMFLATVAE